MTRTFFCCKLCRCCEPPLACCPHLFFCPRPLLFCQLYRRSTSRCSIYTKTHPPQQTQHQVHVKRVMATTVPGTAAPRLTTTGHAYGNKGDVRTIYLNKDSIKPLENQVGGHKTTDNGKPPYILRLGEDRLLKVYVTNVYVSLHVCVFVCVCVKIRKIMDYRGENIIKSLSPPFLLPKTPQPPKKINFTLTGRGGQRQGREGAGLLPDCLPT